MIQLTGAGKRYGPKILFENVDWLVTPNERTGIVGANGTGKSSLLKVLAGIEGLDSGSSTTQKGITLGYLPQDGLSLSGRTVFAECMTVFAGLRALEDEQEHLAHRMAELDPASAEYAQVADRFHHAEAEFRARDGYTIESQVGAVLSGLGFPQRDWKRRTEEFSGGWQMRIALAKLLLEKPNLLLLDEPTNHLDLEARNWLEEYLDAYPNAFVLVSHDRYFLDVTVRKIAELWNKNIHFYTGGYSRYEEQKTERRAQLQAAYPNQRDRIEQLEAFINRFRDQATKAKQVQSRIKELEKIERIEIPPEEKTIHFRFPQPKPSGRIVAEFRGCRKSYGDHPVFSGARPDHRARRPRRAGGYQWRGQIDHDQDTGRRRAGDLRRIHSGPQRTARLLRAGSVQGTRPEGAHDRRSGHRRSARHQHRTAQHPGMLPVLRRRRLQADRRALRR